MHEGAWTSIATTRWLGIVSPPRSHKAHSSACFVQRVLPGSVSTSSTRGAAARALPRRFLLGLLPQSVHVCFDDVGVERLEPDVFLGRHQGADLLLPVARTYETHAFLRVRTPSRSASVHRRLRRRATSLEEAHLVVFALVLLRGSIRRTCSVPTSVPTVSCTSVRASRSRLASHAHRFMVTTTDPALLLRTIICANWSKNGSASSRTIEPSGRSACLPPRIRSRRSKQTHVGTLFGGFALREAFRATKKARDATEMRRARARWTWRPLPSHRYLPRNDRFADRRYRYVDRRSDVAPVRSGKRSRLRFDISPKTRP